MLNGLYAKTCLRSCVFFYITKGTEMKFLCRKKANAYKCQNPVEREQGKTKMVDTYTLFCCTP